MKYEVNIGKYGRYTVCRHCDKVVFPSINASFPIPCPECGETDLVTEIRQRISIMPFNFIGWPGDEQVHYVPKGSKLIVIRYGHAQMVRHMATYKVRDKPEFRVVTAKEAEQRIEACQGGYGE
jgi:predicted RNA-binding Zn-ribbon protein involved in translation (DUF1610 family)